MSAHLSFANLSVYFVTALIAVCASSRESEPETNELTFSSQVADGLGAAQEPA